MGYPRLALISVITPGSRRARLPAPRTFLRTSTASSEEGQRLLFQGRLGQVRVREIHARPGSLVPDSPRRPVLGQELTLPSDTGMHLPERQTRGVEVRYSSNLASMERIHNTPPQVHRPHPSSSCRQPTSYLMSVTVPIHTHVSPHMSRKVSAAPAPTCTRKASSYPGSSTLLGDQLRRRPRNVDPAYLGTYLVISPCTPPPPTAAADCSRSLPTSPTTPTRRTLPTKQRNWQSNGCSIPQL